MNFFYNHSSCIKDTNPSPHGSLSLENSPLPKGLSKDCLTGDSLILTKHGLIPIKKILPEEEVWTHCNRWRKVLHTWKGGKEDTIRVHSSMTELSCSLSHPFYTLRGNTKKLPLPSYMGYMNHEDFSSFSSIMEWTMAMELKGEVVSFPSMGNGELGENEIYQILLSQMGEIFPNISLLHIEGGEYYDFSQWDEFEHENHKQLKDEYTLKLYSMYKSISAHLCGVTVNKTQASPIKQFMGYSFAKAGYKALGVKEIYGIEVEEDNSFIANGIIVRGEEKKDK